LKEYGGIWMDASIICNTSFNWLHTIQKNTKSDFIGYRIKKLELPNSTTPVIESWFFACTKNNKFVIDWCDEFMSTQQFVDIDAYLDEKRKEQVSFQRISYPNYLTIHISAQKLVQQNKYTMCLLDAEEGPYKYLTNASWKKEAAINDLFTGKYNKYPIIKIRGCERSIIERRKYSPESLCKVFQE